MRAPIEPKRVIDGMSEAGSRSEVRHMASLKLEIGLIILRGSGDGGAAIDAVDRVIEHGLGLILREDDAPVVPPTGVGFTLRRAHDGSGAASRQVEVVPRRRLALLYGGEEAEDSRCNI